LRDDTIYFQHISESIDLIQQYLAGPDGVPDRDLFYNDPRTQDAVLRRLETLADAASHLSEVVKARHYEIRWQQISHFRNVLGHGYTDIRLDRVWEAIDADLGLLKSVVHEELRGTSSA
jgi:uncharacterized protein with HEPN domain